MILKTKKDKIHFSAMFRLLDMIVITDESKRKRIIAYTKKLIDNLNNEGYEKDARVVEGYLTKFQGGNIAMAVMDMEE